MSIVGADSTLLVRFYDYYFTGYDFLVIARCVYYATLCNLPLGHDVALSLVGVLCPSDVMK